MRRILVSVVVVSVIALVFGATTAAHAATGAVVLSADRQTVLVSADVSKEAASLLKSDTQFWIVRPRIGIGAHCKIENAIIDKNARIGNNVTISPVGKPDSVDHELYFIRDGIIVIPKNAVIPHGTVI